MSYQFEKKFKTARELIEFFLWNEWFVTGNKYSANSPGKSGTIFRGQSNSNWNLLPSAFRPGTLENFTPQPPPRAGTTLSRHYQLGKHLHAEARAIYIFLESADRIGIPTPLDYGTTRDGLDLIVAALNDDLDHSYKDIFPTRSFERATALAQHHGVPTRFLDWSESPFIAAYFAAFGTSSFSKTLPPPEQEIAIVFTNVSDLRDDRKLTLIKAPRHENSNLLQQKGIFTNITNANEYFIEHGEWPSLNEVAGQDFQLHRALLPVTESDNLLRILFDLGVTRHSLMPSLGNAAMAYEYVRTLYDPEVRTELNATSL